MRARERQRSSEAASTHGVQRFNRGNVERMLERLGNGHFAVEDTVEIFGPIRRKATREVVDAGPAHRNTIVEREAVDERLERRPWRTSAVGEIQPSSR